MSVLNANRRVLPGPSLLHELIAEPTNDATALEFLLADHSLYALTYGDFRDLSHSLTRQIRTLLSPSDSPQIIPVIIPQCPELYVAWRAVLQAGACFCPVSPDVPPERLNFILNDVSAELVLYIEETAALIRNVATDLVCLSVALEALDKDGDYDMTSTEPCKIGPHSPAYVMYTSGSTGLPKGVLVSHASVTQSLLAHDEHIPTFKRFLQFASPTFDVSIFEVFFPLFRGATLVGRVREHLLADLPGTIVKLDADAAELTPTVAGTLLRTRDAAPCLKVLLTIGEMLTKSVIIEFGGDQDKPSMLFAMYGPTEAAIHCTVAPRIPASASVRTIGKPLCTATALILREKAGQNATEIAPCGEPGELAVAGQLADQYLNRPDQNRAAFMELLDHGTVYLTGDRALCNERGELEILGRMNAGQVKLRGQRVELGEIEEVAAKVTGVSQTVASVIGDSLVLFCAGTQAVTVATIQATCKSWLPPFMRPSEVLLLGEALPRLPSGKVDRKKLEQDYRTQEHAVTRPGNIMTPNEQLICSIVQDELQRPLRCHDDLWASGMDSLRAIKLTASLRSHFPAVTVRMVLTSNTVAELATIMSTENGHLANGHSVRIIEDTDEWIEIEKSVRVSLQPTPSSQLLEVLPCTSMQIAMLAETMADSSMNFNTISLTRRGVTEAQLWDAFCMLAEDVDVLRSGFVQTDNDLMPFVRIIWPKLTQNTPSLRHPLQIVTEPNVADTMIVCIHHALYDGWSWDLLLDDLNVILDNETPPERPSFEEVSRLLRSQLPRATGETALHYWSSVLSNCEQTTIPSLVPTRPKEFSRVHTQQMLDLTYEKLSKVSTDLRLSRQTFIQACWALILSAYTGSDDVVFGTVVSGRHAPIEGIQEVIGPCLATLPTRLRLGGVKTIRDLLNYAQRQSLESLNYYDTPLRDIRNASGINSRHTLFDSIVVWQEGFLRSSHKRQYVESADTNDALNYTVVLEVEPIGTELQLKITASRRLIGEQQSRLLIEQFNALLTAIVSEPDRDIEHAWTPVPEKLLSSANSHFTNFSGNYDIAQAVARWAHDVPDRVAIKFVHDFDPVNLHESISDISYFELHERASAMARKLISGYGICPDDLVCVYASKSVELYVAVLAVMMSGAGYMCIDHRTPPDRVKHILQQANCGLVIIDGADNSLCVEYNTVSIAQLSAQKLLGATSSVYTPQSADGKHLAYAVFTSGTTGVPKGVLVTRQNLASHLAHLASVYPYDSSHDSLLQACSPAFDVSVFEIFWTWHVGMTLVAASNDVLFRDIEQFIDHFVVTHLSMTPSVAALVDPDEVPNVKMVVTAGEPMNSKVFQQWSGRALCQGYGPSETTNICNLRPNVQSHDAPNNVGPVFPNTSAFVCRRLKHDQNQSPVLTLNEFQLVPKGATGEIWIGGDQVGRGYVDPELTQHSFFDHPEYGWLYRSGDIGRILADGTFVILGREDDQAKLRGQRIELGDVSHSLLKKDFVDDAVALIDGSQRSARLIAFVVLGGRVTQQAAILELFQYLEDSLPSYMVPDAIIPVGVVPLTRQGKIDRQQLLETISKLSGDALRLFWRQLDGNQNASVLEGTALDIAQALSETLDISLSDIGPKVSFYQLGLDSLSSIHFSRQLRKKGLPQIDVSTILRSPSISALQSAIQTDGHQGGNGSRRSGKTSHGLGDASEYARDFVKVDLQVEKVLPCTDLQLSMLSSSEGAHPEAYRNKILLKVEGDLKALKGAWLQVLGRQQLLRTAYLHNNDPKMPYVQIIVKNHRLPWYKCSEQKPQQATFATPTYEWYRLEVSHRHGVHYLMLDIHHALYDAVAMEMLLREVQAAYQGTPLSPVVPFDRYLEYGNSMNQKAVDSFWKMQLRALSCYRLGDILSSGARPGDGQVINAKQASMLKVTELREFAKRHSTTALSCLQGAVAQLLMVYHKSPSVCFGNIFSGRNLQVEGITEIIGPCFNTLPVPARADKNSSNLDLIRNLQSFNLDMLPFQPSSLRRIQQQNSPDGIPMFDFLLLLQQTDQQLDQSLWQLVAEEGDMDFPFILEVSEDETSDAIHLTLHSTLTNTGVLCQILNDFDDLFLDTMRYPEAVAFHSRVVPRADFLQLPAGLTSDDPLNGGVEESSSDSAHLSPTGKKVLETMLALSPLEFGHITTSTTIFKLGLDSINAVQLASRLRDQGFKITSTQILQGPTLGEIAATCSATSSTAEHEEYIHSFDFDRFDNAHRSPICAKISLQESDVAAIRPCTPLQDGIISQYLQSGGRLYYNRLRFRVRPGVQLSKVVEAWRHAMDRHDMLRTGFVECENEACNFLMVVYRPEFAALPCDGLGGHGEESDSVDDPVLSLSRPPWRLTLEPENHVVALSILHALYDAQSLDIMLADVACDFLGRQPDNIRSPRPIISSILSSKEQEDALQFWSREDNYIQPTRFPNLHIHTQPEDRFSIAERSMSVALTKASNCCAELGFTLQVICQAAWARILSAYTGQERVTFGIILSGRAFGDERDDIAFPCINTLPFSGVPGVNIQTFLQNTSSTNAGLLSYQQTPLTSIKRWQGLEDEAFNTVLVLQKYESKLPKDAPWDVIDETATAEYGMSLEISPDSDSDLIKLHLTFSESLIPKEAASIILQQLEEQISAILQHNEHVAIGVDAKMLSVLSPVENRIPSEVSLLHEFVERSARLRPSCTALEFIQSFEEEKAVKQTWTYIELNLEGNRIANLLLSVGAKPGDLVATCFDKCPEASFAILGILKAGCAYVAIDPGAPADRKKFILGDAGCRILLTTSDKLAALVADDNVQCLAVDSKTTLRYASSEQPTLTSSLKPTNTCYCLYTSGTTGTPKGCLISHDSAVQAMMAFRRIFQGHWKPGSRWLQFASFHFDVSVLEQYWSWSVGICMTSAPRDLILEDLPTFLRLAKITHLDLTPSLARFITPDDVPSLCDGVFIVGGEQVSQDIIETWGDAGCLYNFYGPSEVTIGCTVHPRVRRGVKPTNIGQLWDNVGAMILQPGKEDAVLRGSVGELCLTGVLVGKGYLNRPELTSEKFAVLSSGERVYRTGDLVRLLHDNSFEFLGRIDGQVKLRGQRLEVGEIDQVIKTTTNTISAVATMVLSHPTQGKDRLVAFLTTSKMNRGDHNISLELDSEALELAAKVRRHCMSKLPGYMVPTELFMVSSMPLSANNKVELKVLKKLYEEADLEGSQTAHQQNLLTPDDQEVFQRVSEAIAQRLHLSSDAINPGSRLFELGLDSVSAIGLAHVLRSRGFKNASIHVIMRSPVVTDLVHAMKQSQADDATHDIEESKRVINEFATRHRTAILRAVDVPIDQIEDISPCTPLQEGMISKSANSSPGDGTYFSEFSFEVGLAVNLNRLDHAWQAIAAVTSILRTRFVPTADGYAQVVLVDDLIPVHMEDDLHTPKGTFDEWVEQAKVISGAQPWKVTLSRGPGSMSMKLFIFHGLYDGVALDLLLEKVAKVYDNEEGNQLSQSRFYEVLPYGPLATRTGSEVFWKENVPTIRLLGASIACEDTIGSLSFTLQSDRIRLPRLDSIASALNITLPAVFHAAWLYCLERYYHVNPTLGLVVSGRSIAHERADSIIGPMFNTIPCTVGGLQDGSTIRDLMRTCHNFNMNALPYQHTPLRQIAKWLGIDTSKRCFDCLFVFQRERTDAYEHDHWRALASTTAPDYPLNLEIEQKKDGSFTLVLVGKAQSHSQMECSKLLGDFVSLLEQLDHGESVPLPKAFTIQPDQQVLQSGQKGPTASTTGSASNGTWTTVSKAIRGEVAQLANVSNEGITLINPSLFELGLDSIDVMKLATRLKQAGVKVPISAIMRAPTVAGIAAAAEKARQELRDGPDVASAFLSLEERQNQYRAILHARRMDIHDDQIILPVTAMQEGLLLDYQKYYNVVAYELLPGTDIDGLIQAWQATAASQAILRTRFVSVEDDLEDATFLQIIRQTVELEIQRSDHGDPRVAVGVLKEEAADRGLSMPVAKLVFLKSNNKRIMLVGMPHAAYDGWSIQLLHQEVTNTYQKLTNDQFETGTKARSPQDHLEAVLEEANSSTSKAFWERTVKQTGPTLMRVPKQSALSCSPQLLQHVSSISSADAQRFCQRVGVTMQSLGLAACSSYLACEGGSVHICFGLVLSGRTTEGSDELFFPTFNTVLFSAHLDAKTPATGLVQAVHNQALSASEHQHYPLKETLKLARQEHGQGELFNTLFTYQKVPAGNIAKNELYREIELGETPTHPPYAVNIELEAKQEKLLWTLASQQGIYTTDQAQHALGALDQFLTKLVKEPDESVFNNEEQSTLRQAKARVEPSSDEPLHTQPTADAVLNLTHSEKVVRDVLAETSMTDPTQISKTTNIFNLGLDSISAIKLAGSLKKRGLKVQISKIIEMQTVEKMAAAAEHLAQRDGGLERRTGPTPNNTIRDLGQYAILLRKNDLTENDIEDVLAATGGQHYMLGVWQASGRQLLYPSFWFEIKASEDAIATAMQSLVSIQPMLRTTFLRNGQDILQVRLTPTAARAGRATTPWSFNTHRRSNSTNLVLTLHIHHALYDAVSIRILIDQLNRLCRNLSPSPQNNIIHPFLTATHTLPPETQAAQRAFWTHYLRPAHRNLPAQLSTYTPRTSHFTPHLHAWDSLGARLRAEGVSAQALFFALIGRVYATRLLPGPSAPAPPSPSSSSASSVHPDESVVLGIYLSNRALDVPGLPDLAAPTVNVVPLRVRIGAGVNVWDAARDVQRDLSEIGRAQNCGVGLREVWAWTGLRVGCVVNWLSLPDAELGEGSGGAEDNGDEERVVCHAGEEVRTEMGVDDVEGLGGTRAEPSPFADEEGASGEVGGGLEWVVPSVDVEAKIEGGYLAMGLFAPEDLVGGAEGLEGLFEGVREGLMQAEGKGKERAIG